MRDYITHSAAQHLNSPPRTLAIVQIRITMTGLTVVSSVGKWEVEKVQYMRPSSRLCAAEEEENLSLLEISAVKY
jgi:hypothetical protein